MQIIQGNVRILCVELDNANRKRYRSSPDRMHPTCFELGIEDEANFSQRCLSLEQEDFAALEAAVRRITDARPVRSPPFGFFRPPTPSPVEICIMHALGTCLQIRIACEHMRTSMRIGPYAPVCACAHALACKIARARACICISRIVHHNLATCLRTQLSMPQEPARTRTHTRACTQAGSSSDSDAEAGSDSDAEPNVHGGADVVSNSGSESEAEKPLVPVRRCNNAEPHDAAAAAIDLPTILRGPCHVDAFTLPLAALDGLGFYDGLDIDGAAVSPHRPYPERFRVHSCSDRAPRPPSSRCLPCSVSCRGAAGAQWRRGADYPNPADQTRQPETAAAQQ